MKKKLSLILVSVFVCLSFAACGNAPAEKGSTENKKPSKKEYVEDSQISDVFTAPEKFKGKYIKMSGRIFGTPEKSENEVAIQAWHNPDNASNNFVTYYKGTDIELKENDYIIVDGEIKGTFEGENAFGGKVTAPMIVADSIEVQSYIDAVVPTIKEIAPANAVVEQNGVSLKVDKVEFAEKETRVYLTESNASPDKFSMWVYSIKIVQNGQQIEQDNSMSVYDGNYAQLSSDILPNASSSGVLVFPPMDSSANFQIYAEGHSDNYQIDFQPFTIDISVQ